MSEQQDALRVLMEQRLAAARAKAGTGIPARPDPLAPQPLSPTQVRLWFNAQFELNTSIYHVPAELRISGQLDATALLDSLREIAERHVVLRSVIDTSGAEPLMVVVPAERVPLSVVDIPEAALEQAIHDEVRIPFRLDQEPPMRGTLFRVSPTEHVLVLTVHHIATDAWSQDLTLDELSGLYAARLGQGTAPAAPRLQYADVTAWELEHQKRGAADWWAERLEGLAPVLALPTDRPYPAVADWSAGEIPVRVPLELSERMRQVARETGTTPFMVILAAWQALLGRLCQTEDVPVGVPESGRRHKDTEAVLGCFINTLVMRTDLSGDPTGRELLGRVRETALEAFAHADVPFERVVELIQPERSTATTPIFQSMLYVLDNELRNPVLPGAQVTRLDTVLDANKFDVSLSLVGSPQGFRGELLYRKDLLDGLTGQRWARWFLALLAGMLADLDKPLSAVDILSPAETSELLALGTGPQLPAGAPSTVVDAVLAQVAARPQAVAVDGLGGSLTYGELGRVSAAVAAGLLAHGVETGARVGVCLPRDRYMPAALVGVLRAGGAYVPLEAEHPVDRLRYQLTDSGARVILASAETMGVALGLVAGSGVRVLDVAELMSVDSGQTELPVVKPEDLIYVLYTSGSTGRPKGVELSHSAVAAYVAANCEIVPVGDRDVMLGLTALSFDVFGLEIWISLTQGIPLVLLDRKTAVDGHLVAQRIAEFGVNLMTSTPTTFRMLVAAGWQAPDLRLIAIGEIVDPGLARELVGRVREVWNGYGPTETAIASTMYRVLEPIEDTVPVGTPLAGEWVYIMDPAGKPALPGTIGELWIGGAGVGIGYHNRPDLTTAAFVADPFRPAGRCYRTGDLARWRTDGLIEFLGRRDHQVKVRGYRIELGEIETQLRAMPEVADAVVVVSNHGGDAHLIGYLLRDPAATTVDLAQVETRLRADLPEYMVPRRWMVLDALPTTASGKVDRAALPEPEDEIRERQLPRTEAEQLVAEIWASVLRQEELSADDNFFALGGHSLSATLVIGRLRDALDLTVPVRLLFEQPVLANFAAALEGLLLAEVDTP